MIKIFNAQLIYHISFQQTQINYNQYIKRKHLKLIDQTCTAQLDFERVFSFEISSYQAQNSQEVAVSQKFQIQSETLHQDLQIPLKNSVDKTNQIDWTSLTPKQRKNLKKRLKRQALKQQEFLDCDIQNCQMHYLCAQEFKRKAIQIMNTQVSSNSKVKRKIEAKSVQNYGMQLRRHLREQEVQEINLINIIQSDFTKNDQVSFNHQPEYNRSSSQNLIYDEESELSLRIDLDHLDEPLPNEIQQQVNSLIQEQNSSEQLSLHQIHSQNQIIQQDPAHDKQTSLIIPQIYSIKVYLLKETFDTQFAYFKIELIKIFTPLMNLKSLAFFTTNNQDILLCEILFCMKPTLVTIQDPVDLIGLKIFYSAKLFVVRSGQSLKSSQSFFAKAVPKNIKKLESLKEIEVVNDQFIEETIEENLF